MYDHIRQYLKDRHSNLKGPFIKIDVYSINVTVLSLIYLVCSRKHQLKKLLKNKTNSIKIIRESLDVKIIYEMQK